MQSSDHIKAVAQKRATVLRIKRELTVQKANLKVAEADLDLALASLAEFAEKQLAFDLTE